MKADRPGKLQLEVFELVGKAVAAFERVHAGGRQMHDFDLELTLGMYLYRVQLNGNTQTEKLLVR